MGILIRRQKIETVIITHEFVRFRMPNEVITAWCGQCEQETRLLLPEDAAILTGVTTRQIYRAVELGRVHFIELSKGTLLICPNSIFQAVSEAANVSASAGPQMEKSKSFKKQARS